MPAPQTPHQQRAQRVTNRITKMAPPVISPAYSPDMQPPIALAAEPLYIRPLTQQQQLLYTPPPYFVVTPSPILPSTVYNMDPPAKRFKYGSGCACQDCQLRASYVQYQYAPSPPPSSYLFYTQRGPSVIPDLVNSPTLKSESPQQLLPHSQPTTPQTIQTTTQPKMNATHELQLERVRCLLKAARLHSDTLSDTTNQDDTKSLQIPQLVSKLLVAKQNANQLKKRSFSRCLEGGSDEELAGPPNSPRL
ncbi:UNVERIFIED_CONTAM: hypothetical protein HDU68_010413 [Siphonaria sp. JEL0065]|nr:hypothetical protein HDU68_010413 [Siphonaria sp. JEL0065]